MAQVDSSGFYAGRCNRCRLTFCSKLEQFNASGSRFRIQESRAGLGDLGCMGKDLTSACFGF